MQTYDMFAPQPVHGRAFRHAQDEPPRLYSQDPNFQRNTSGPIKDELGGASQYDFNFETVVHGSGSMPSSNLQFTEESHLGQYTNSAEDRSVKTEEEELYLHTDEFGYDERRGVFDGESDRSLSESPGATESNLIVSDSAYSSVGRPSELETEQYLRQSLGIPYPTPLTLYALPDDLQGPNRPSITTLARLAIWGSPSKKLTLGQIYEAIESRYPSMGTLIDKPHRRSIRHNLSLKGIFRQERRPQQAPGQGDYWVLDVRYGEENKRRRGRKEQGRHPRQTQVGTFVPQLFPSEEATQHRTSTSFSQFHAPLRRNYSNPEMMSRTLNDIHHSHAMLESLRDTDIDPNAPFVRPSYGSTIPDSGYVQPLERLPSHFTGGRYQQVSEDFSGNHLGYQSRNMRHLQSFYVPGQGYERGSNRGQQQPQQRHQQAEYLPNIAGINTHNRHTPRRSYSDETFDRDIHTEERDADRAPHTSRRTG